MYLEYHSVYPLVRIGTPPPTPSSLPSEPKGGTHSSGGEGVGGSQFGRLCLYSVSPPIPYFTVFPTALHSMVKAEAVQCSPNPCIA
jgi:hypothetical protein